MAGNEEGPALAKNWIHRKVLIGSGTLFLMIGVLGIFLPLLPTTPFLLLAGACYLRGSRKMHHWLMTNHIFGKHLRSYSEKRGVPLRIKIWTLSLLWVTIAISAVLFTESIFIRILLLIIAVSVSVHVVWIKTLKK